MTLRGLQSCFGGKLLYLQIAWFVLKTGPQSSKIHAFRRGRDCLNAKGAGGYGPLGEFAQCFFFSPRLGDSSKQTRRRRRPNLSEKNDQTHRRNLWKTRSTPEAHIHASSLDTRRTRCTSGNHLLRALFCSDIVFVFVFCFGTL